jgi:hypothetical protein
MKKWVEGLESLGAKKRPMRAPATLSLSARYAYIVRLSMDWMCARMPKFTDLRATDDYSRGQACLKGLSCLA